jgi:type I restriction enzyme S subunit
MIEGLKPYPAMKDSGVPWLGYVPVHWSLLPLKRWVGINEEVLPETTAPEYEFRYIDIGSVGTGVLTAKPQGLRFGGAPSRARRIVRNGDTIVSTVRTYLKAVYFVDGENDELVCSTGFAVFTPQEQTIAKFVSYLCQSSTFTDRVTADSFGIAYPAITETKLGAFHVAVPPAGEQAAIVRFLDHADVRIRRYVAAKQKLITLLEEEKQAIIHRAVTRGLDPNVRLKPSGVPWLGDVPEHWEIVALRRLTMARCDGPFGSGLKSGHYTDHGVRVIRLQNIGHGEFRDADSVFIDPAYYATLGDHSVEAGDLLIAGLGDERHPAGRACVAPESIPPAMVKADCFRFRIRKSRLDPHFAALHLSATASGASLALSTGATRQRTNLQSTASRKIAIPSVAEQLDIIRYIERETGEIWDAIAVTEHEISLLREYRTRLIADVVTGKLDVREAAAKLPEIELEAKPLDEIDDVSQDEDSAEAEAIEAEDVA